MKNDLFALIFMFLTIFGFVGWYIAEADNEVLRQQLAAIDYQKVNRYAH